MGYIEEVYDRTYNWNPWHGCIGVSEGCLNCYVKRYDSTYGVSFNKVKLNKTKVKLPIRKDKHGEWRIPPGSVINTSFMSDFFIEQADNWRSLAWEIVRKRKDCLFYITTKRVERIKDCLPDDWFNGWNNVIIGVTVENQRTADERLGRFVLDIPCKHKHIIAEPLLEDIDISMYLCGGDIEQITVGGESCPYNLTNRVAREFRLEWAENLCRQAKEYDVNFLFHSVGSKFIKDGKPVKIRFSKDERQLAPFYKLDYTNSEGYIKEKWVQSIPKIEEGIRADEAMRIWERVKRERRYNT